MKMSELSSAKGSNLLSIFRDHNSLSLDECLMIEEAWTPSITAQERLLFLLESEHPELHRKAIEDIGTEV